MVSAAAYISTNASASDSELSEKNLRYSSIFWRAVAFPRYSIVVNATRPQERFVQRFNSVRSHHKQNIRRRVETIQHVQQPRKRDSVAISNVFLLTAGLSTTVGACRWKVPGLSGLHAIDIFKEQHRVGCHLIDRLHQSPVIKITE